MELSDRRKKILQVVIDDYIQDVEPISSKKVQERHLQEVSSATIRSELAALEEMGFLGQPHTSAGRIPLPKAYRYYVDKLMEKGRLTRGEIEFIHGHFNKNISEAENIVKSAAKVISDLTHYTGIGIDAPQKEEIIENIKLVQLSAKTTLLIVVTDCRVLKDSIIINDFETDEIFIEAGAEILRGLLCGKSLINAVSVSEDIISEEFNQYRMLFENVLGVFRRYIDDGGEKIITEGTSNTLRFPEFTDIDKARNFLTIIDSKAKLASMLKEGSAKAVELTVKIGSEDGDEDAKDFSLVTANYSLMGKNIGSAGVLGPIRMDYGKVIGVLECIRQTIDALIKK